MIFIGYSVHVHESEMAVSLPAYHYKGKEFTFLDAPVRLLEELKCPICLEILFEPVVTGCKHLFCEKCVKVRKQSCPTCRKWVSETVPDVGIARVLKAFKVKCLYSSEGCEWQGELGDAEEHLKNCQYKKPECPNGCGGKMNLELLEEHCRELCPNRSFKCPHCGKVGMFEYITTTHNAICGDFPLLCPAGCGDKERKRKRKNMQSHLSTECPEEYVSCKYATFGCDTAVRRREKESHFSDDTFHFKKSMESQIAMFQSLGTLFQSSTYTRPDVASLPLSFRPWLQNTPTCYPRPPWVVKLEGFEEKRLHELWYSEPVYSHFGGYKMRLCIYPQNDEFNDGDDEGEGEGEDDDTGEACCVSVYACLMKGDNDDNLKFPFKGHIVVSLLNQLKDQNHHTQQLWRPEQDIPESISGRVTTVDNNNGWGSLWFVMHNDLALCPASNHQYLKNNSLFFRIEKFEPAC